MEGKKTIRVTFVVERGGAGNGRVWWAAFKPEDVEIVGIGSGQRVAIKRDAKPLWLPKPDGKRTYLCRKMGTRIDGEAWVDLEVGTIIKCYAECAGGFRCAVVKSPVLVVEEGAKWEGGDSDGSRWVEVKVIGARPITLNELSNK